MRKHKFRGLTGGLTFFVIVILIMTESCSYIARKRNPYLRQEVYGAITIGKEWSEIKLLKPIKAERQINRLVLEYTNDYNWDLLNQLRTSNGTLFFPDVELVDDSGRPLKLTWSSTREGAVGFAYHDSRGEEALPRDRMFSIVRLRSAEPLNCMRLVWESTNSWDH